MQFSLCDGGGSIQMKYNQSFSATKRISCVCVCMIEAGFGYEPTFFEAH